MFTSVKTGTEVASMRESGKMLAAVLNTLKDYIEPGMSTKELADNAKNELNSLGGQPTFLGYHGFPDVLCVSINDEVVHGIPSYDRIIGSGDIVSIDFGVTYRGMITDSALSVIAGGSGGKAVTNLLRITEESLMAGINILRDGIKVGTISSEIQKVLDKSKLGIVRDLVGHGVGHNLHEEPNIPNFGSPNRGPKLRTGMTIALEPMATVGDYRVIVDSDNWTVRTADGSLSAHFEHTLLITDDGCEILTAR